MPLNASTRRRSSSDDRTAMRASKSPRAMRPVARVSWRIGSAIRSAIDSPIAAPSRMKNSAARWTPRSSSSISRSISCWRKASGTVSIALRPPARTGAAASRNGIAPMLVLGRRSWAAAAGRSRDRRRRACASAAGPTRTDRARWSRRAPACSKTLTSWSINWLIQTITSSRPAWSRLRRRAAGSASDSSMTRCATAAVRDRLAFDVGQQQAGEVGRGSRPRGSAPGRSTRARTRGTACGRSWRGSRAAAIARCAAGRAPAA